MRVAFLILLPLALVPALFTTYLYLQIWSVRNAPIVEGEIIRRERTQWYGMPRNKLTIEIAGPPKATVFAIANNEDVRNLPKNVRFHYAGDPGREVFVEGQENPLWIALFFWVFAVLCAGIFFVPIIVRRRAARRKARIREERALAAAGKPAALSALAASEFAPFQAVQVFALKANRLYRVFLHGPELTLVFLKNIWGTEGAAAVHLGLLGIWLAKREAKKDEQKIAQLIAEVDSMPADDLLAEESRSYRLDSQAIVSAKLEAPGQLWKYGQNVARLTIQTQDRKLQFALKEPAQVQAAIRVLDALLADDLEIEDKLRHKLGAAFWADANKPSA